jgi:cyclopropane-fatty-acyl-phospholipid synthase
MKLLPRRGVADYTFRKIKRDGMTVLTSLDGQKNLPRYFTQVFAMAGRIDNGRLDVVLDDGRRFRLEGPKPGPVAEVHIHNPDVFARLIREGDMGFSEAYMDGWWSTPDLQAFMDLIHNDNPALYDDFPGRGFVRAFEKLRHWLRSNNKFQAKKNIAYHYDLGNDFYRLWLDDSMTYSSALFKTGQESLEKAQEQKYAAMCDAIGARPGEHVLEIGCGWGGFAEYAARERGLRVTGLTISREQHDYAVARIARAGLSDKVEIKLQDYRDETGRYDNIASIEMFEAVGEKYWPVFFRKVKDSLKPGGTAAMQIITINEAAFDSYRRRPDFIQRYVFPGGMLPTPSLLKTLGSDQGLSFLKERVFAQDYARTLADWRERFWESWEKLVPLGFDDRFRKLWEFYLHYCEAGFRAEYIDVRQVVYKA